MYPTPFELYTGRSFAALGDFAEDGRSFGSFSKRVTDIGELADELPCCDDCAEPDLGAFAALIKKPAAAVPTQLRINAAQASLIAPHVNPAVARAPATSSSSASLRAPSGATPTVPMQTLQLPRPAASASSIAFASSALPPAPSASMPTSAAVAVPIRMQALGTQAASFIQQAAAPASPESYFGPGSSGGGSDPANYDDSSGDDSSGDVYPEDGATGGHDETGNPLLPLEDDSLEDVGGDELLDASSDVPDPAQVAAVVGIGTGVLLLGGLGAVGLLGGGAWWLYRRHQRAH